MIVSKRWCRVHHAVFDDDDGCYGVNPMWRAVATGCDVVPALGTWLVDLKGWRVVT